MSSAGGNEDLKIKWEISVSSIMKCIWRVSSGELCWQLSFCTECWVEARALEEEEQKGEVWTGGHRKYNEVLYIFTNMEEKDENKMYLILFKSDN